MTSNGGQRFIISLLRYIIFSLLFFFATRQPWYVDSIVYFLVVFLLLLERDIVAFFGIDTRATHRVFAYKSLYHDWRRGAITIGRFASYMNHIYAFPTTLIVYIVFLLGKQLDISGLQDILSSIPDIEYSLLGLVALSGVGTLFQDDADTHYISMVQDRKRTRRFILVTVFLSMLAVVIIFQETQTLGLLSFPISLISGLLVFLIGIMLLEEDDN